MNDMIELFHEVKYVPVDYKTNTQAKIMTMKRRLWALKILEVNQVPTDCIHCFFMSNPTLGSWYCFLDVEAGSCEPGNFARYLVEKAI